LSDNQHRRSAILRLVEVLILGASEQDPPPGLPESATGARYSFADDEPAVRAALPSAEAIFHWSERTDLLRAAWPSARALRWIHVAGVGVDWSLFPDLIESEVVVTNCRGVFDVTMPEYVLALMLALAKDLRGTLDSQAEHVWRHRPLDQLAGRTAVVVGAGSIGLATARLLRAVGLRVTSVARRARAGEAGGPAIQAVDDLPELLRDADWLVLVAPLTPETRGLIGAAELALLPPSARLVNIGRGPVVDEGALVAALREGRIAGAALDVFGREPLPADHPLWSMPEVIVSPHIGGDVPGWETWFTESFLANLRRYGAGQPLLNVVDKRLGYVPSEVPELSGVAR
jgi:phosphoglycerate dehydrogenase-like enzyme